MDLEMKTILQSLKEKTGLEIGVFSETMKYTANTRSDGQIVHPSRWDFEEVLADQVTGKTFFRIRYHSASLIGFIDGTGETERNYATLIASLIENSTGKDSSLSRADQIRSILLGDTSRPQIQKFMRKFSVPDVRCFVLVLSLPAGRSAEVINFLSNFTTNALDASVVMDDLNVAFVKFLDNENENEYQSATDFAAVLAQSLADECGILVHIGVGGTVKHMMEVAQSYQQAAVAIRMQSAFKSKGEVHSYKEYVLIKMLEDIPKFKLAEYLEILSDEGAKTIFSDPEMINTAEEFLENSLNVSETSRNLYMHRNTLMYRLDKIERATGLNIRKFSDAVTFRLITILYKILK